MPRTANSNGIRPEFRALAVIQLNVPVTPAEINACVGYGNYAAKYISLLKKAGFRFTTTKDKRTVTAYTMVSEPDNALNLRNAPAKTVAQGTAVGPVGIRKPKSYSNLDKGAKDAQAAKILKSIGLGNGIDGRPDGEVGAYMVDNDFDGETRGLSLRDLGLT